MQEDIWSTTGMNSTFMLAEQALAYGDVSYGHTIDPEHGNVIAQPANAYQCWWTFPAGDAFTTARDMAKWSMMLMDSGWQTLSPSSASLTLTPAVQTHFPGNDQYGMGSFHTNIDGLDVVHHGGHVPGWSASLLMLPQLNLSITALTNGDNGAGEISRCILEQVFDLPWPQTPNDQTTSDSWQQYTGIYRLLYDTGRYYPAFVFLKNQQLWVSTFDPVQKKWLKATLNQVHNDSFYIDLDGDGQLSGDIELFTFISNETSERPSMWLRGLFYVGERLFK